MKEMENAKDLELYSKKDENEHEDRFGLPAHDKHGEDSEMSNEFECKK
jgi:hypothetical protein